MARRGEIDPWNIDVVDITDRFLKKVESAKKLDLRVSGRVLLYAAILVRMKAEAITTEAIGLEESEDVFETSFVDEAMDFSEMDENNFDEIIIQALAKRRRIRRITTLKELIEELRRAEEVEKRRRKRRRLKEEGGIEVALKVPHEESLEEMIKRVEREVLEMLQKKDFVSFFSLVKGYGIPTVVDYYLSILHLAFRKKLSLRQEEFYGDIIVERF